VTVTEGCTGQLSLRVLEGFALEDAGGRSIAIANRKACALFAYLSMSQSPSETRERLAGLLWSDSGEEQARASLRQCVKQLRSALDEAGFTGFRADRHDLALTGSGLSLDLYQIDEALSRGQVSPRLLEGTVSPDRILYGFEGLDQSFASWLHVVRQNWHDRLVDLLQKLQNRPEHDAPTMRDAALALVNLDPTHEEAQRRLIRHYADEGNTAAALRQYKLLWELLDDEYDMEPSEETQALIVEIKSGRYVATRTSAALTVIGSAVAAREKVQPELPVIGVSTFVPAGPSDHENYLIEGFRREIIASLVRFREWIVVEDVRRLPDPDKSDQTSFERPRSPVGYHLEGIFQEQSAKVRLVITLKELASRRYIWSEQILLTLENWFDAQQDIVRRIAVALNVYLSVERLDRISGRPDVSLDVYDRWLRGQELTLEWRPEAHARAREIFKSVIDETPHFGRAVSSLVQLENAAPLVHPGTFRSKERCEENVRLARRAVQIDPLDSRAHLCLGWAYAINGQFDVAEIHFALACDLNHNDSWTLVSSALGWAFCDRIDVAQRLSEQALSLGLVPSKSHWGYQATIKFLSADYEGCVEATVYADGALHNLSAWKTSALYHIGRQSEAEEEARQFLDLIRRHWSGPSPVADHHIAEWLLQCFPIKNHATWRQLRDGLRAAGVPMSPRLMGTPQRVDYPHWAKE